MSEPITQVDEFSEEDLEGLVDIFRTLLDWEKELNNDKEVTNGCDNNQPSQRCSSGGRILSGGTGTTKPKICGT